MAEEQDSPREEKSPDTGEDEELWDSTPDLDEEEEETDTVTEEEAEDEESEEETEVEEEDDPSHNFEKRYKDLEREFHRRNEESARFKEEFNDLRLRTLEQDKELVKLREGYKEPGAPPDPMDEKSFFDDDDRTTMEEFSEITGVTKKLVQHEVAKALKDATPDNQRVVNLEQAYQEQSYQQFLQNHAAYMSSSVGDDYRDIDRDPDFQAYVLASPALTKMMTESREPTDHASVMNLWLDNTDRGKGWRPAEKPSSEGTAKKQSSRRKAASNLMSNSAPRIERNPDSMSDEELWDSVPEPEQE